MKLTGQDFSWAPIRGSKMRVEIIVDNSDPDLLVDCKTLVGMKVTRGGLFEPFYQFAHSLADRGAEVHLVVTKKGEEVSRVKM